MENGRGATCSANSDLCFTKGEESPRDVFPQEVSHLNGPYFLGVNVLLVRRVAVFWDVSCDFLRFRERANPLVVVVELLRGQVFFFLQKHHLRVEQEAALFRQVSRGRRGHQWADPGHQAESWLTLVLLLRILLVDAAPLPDN